MNARLVLAVLLPFMALTLQWLLWPWIAPFVWFLYFPAVFFSARLGGLPGGLATVQRIVHRHGGIIEARGEPGKAAVFCFSLARQEVPENQT